MTDLFEYVVSEVKSGRLAKVDAVKMLRQVQSSHNGQAEPGKEVLHPLLHENTSDLREQRFTTRFSGQEFFLSNHVVRGAKVLPGVCYLEMVRAALEISSAPGPDDILCMKNVVWLQPIVVAAKPKEVHLRVYAKEDGWLGYEVYSERNEGGGNAGSLLTKYFEGIGQWQPRGRQVSYEIEKLQQGCTMRVSPQECYQAYRRMGFEYGPAYQGVKEIGCGHDAHGNYSLTRVSLPESALDGAERFELHPSMMDSALHSVFGFVKTQLNDATPQEGEEQTWIPFAVDELRIGSRCGHDCWVVIRGAAGSTKRVRKVNYEICNEQGLRCVEIYGFSLRAVNVPLVDAAPRAAARAIPPPKLMSFEEYWHEEALAGPQIPVKTVLCLLSETANQCEMTDRVRAMDPHAKVVFVSTGQGVEQHSSENYNVVRGDAISYMQALDRIRQDVGVADAVMYMWAVEEGVSAADYGNIVCLLQAMAESQFICKRVVLAGRCSNSIERCYLDSWHGFGRSLRLLWPDTSFVVVGGDSGNHERGSVVSMQPWIERVWTESRLGGTENVFYTEMQRSVSRMRETVRVNAPAALRQSGSYLITGGMGGLGLLFAQYLARQYGANLLLTGRSMLTDEQERDLAELRGLGVRVMYERVDVSDVARMRLAIASAQKEFGGLHGVIHAAGIMADMPVFSVSQSAFEQALAAKISGTLVLDDVLQGIDLDFVCYFSSSSAVLGDFGQCSYAIGNRFQAAYARWGISDGSRRVVAINWPLWKEGRMGSQDAEQTRLYLESSGQRALTMEEGRSLFEQLVAEGLPQQLVMIGQAAHVHQLLGIGKTAKTIAAMGAVNLDPTVSATREPIKGIDAEERTLDFVKKLFAEVLSLAPERMDLDAGFEEYGIDSIMAVRLTNELEKIFGTLSKTLLFEVQSIKLLAKYLLREHQDRVSELIGMEYSVPAADGAIAAESQERTADTATLKRGRFAVEADIGQLSRTSDIAIIGMSGRFPLANNLHEFWENLKAGKDCIREAPSARWGSGHYLDLENDQSGKSYSRWGGFMEEVDQFDHDFFGYSFEEAKVLDLREKPLMEVVWELMEDSGYTPELLNSKHQGNVGVYIGALMELSKSPSSLTFASVRISDFLQLTGPSLVVDTQSASSMTALHLACEGLVRADCSAAIVGCSFRLSPELFATSAALGLLASRKDSRGFTDGDGFLLAEGVGAVFLKPLADAERDNDRISAVIKASATNWSSGAVSKKPLRSLKAREDLVRKALHKSKIDARSITYVEAAVNGLPMTDFLEISVLDKVFKEKTKDKHFCTIGSVESNIGHGIPVSGMAQLAKVVLQMRDRLIIPTIAAERPSPAFSFDDSPFLLARSLSTWEQPCLTSGPDPILLPRRALISSHGAGGTNVCVVLEEYTSKTMVTASCPTENSAAQLVLLSARTESQLRAYATRLISYIACSSGIPLSDLAYTLRSRRKAMEYRLAIIATSLDDLRAELGWYSSSDFADRARAPDLSGEVQQQCGSSVSTYYGCRTVGSGELSESEKTTAKELKLRFANESNLRELALCWVNGDSLPTEVLDRKFGGQLISLPPYAFERSNIDSSQRAEHLAMRLSSSIEMLHEEQES